MKLLNPFDYPAPSGRTVGEIAMGPVTAAGATPRVVDVGARSGMFDLPVSFTQQADFVGFEPNQAEYDKLMNGTTDAMKTGIRQPKFKTQTYFPKALWSEACERELVITIGAGACSLHGPSNQKMTSRMYLEGRESAAYADNVQQPVGKLMVPCARLDAMLSPPARIDYLKVDAEGSEVEVFKGAAELFAARCILLIKTEFLLTPYYKEHALLGHQHVFLDRHGFRMIDIDLKHPRYLRDRTRVSPATDRRPVYAGDAYFILDPELIDLPALDQHRTAVVLLLFGFNSLALTLCRDAGLLSAADLGDLELALSRAPLYKRLKHAWNRFPGRVGQLLHRVGLA